MEISNKIPFSNPKFKNGLEPFQHKIVKDVLESRKKIVMINAPTGCHGYDTPIQMYNRRFFGEIKKVQDIQLGELILGDNDTPRKVMELFRGKDVLYKVIPKDEEPFVVNSRHILSLVKPFSYTLDIEVIQYLKQNQDFKSIHKLYRNRLTNPKQFPLFIDFTLEEIGVGDYYGFQLNGNNLYCIGNYIINHNSGKSPIGMTLAHHLNYPNQSLYLCSSKILQDQLSKDFTEAYQLKGRGNYPCSLLPSYNADRCFQQCDEYKCGDTDCAYEDAKKIALQSTFAILNMHYYENETNYVGRFSKRKTVIIDEADVLEDVLIDFIALDIHPKTLEKFKLDQPKYVTKLDSWKEWADKTLKILGEKVVKLLKAEDHLDNESKLELNKLSRMCLKLNMLKNDITEDWIFEHDEKFRFQPLWLDTKLTQQYLLRHAERFVMMSATMLPKVIACKLLGLEVSDVDYHEIDSPIPIANRPIIYKPIKKLKYGESEDKVYDEIKKTIDKYKGVKGIIHAVSYTRAKVIAGLSSRCITHNTYDKNEKIRQFFDSKDGILVSPSCERGLDLHGDLGRFVIWAKVPFPNTTDKVVSKRLYSSPFGKLWYRAVTAQTIAQGAGRIVRGVKDFGTTHIFDSSFDSVIEFTPKWFKDAIKVEF